jgi:hypothetical protein
MWMGASVRAFGIDVRREGWYVYYSDSTYWMGGILREMTAEILDTESYEIKLCSTVLSLHFVGLICLKLSSCIYTRDWEH